jgi:hypothetical protein
MHGIANVIPQAINKTHSIMKGIGVAAIGDQLDR